MHKSRVNAVEMPAIRSMIGVKLSDRVRNEVIREECGVKEDVVTKIEKNMMRWFGHAERMDKRRLSNEIYEADVGGNAGRERPRRTLLDKIGEVLEKARSRVPETGERVWGIWAQWKKRKVCV
jgi:hypothetical protein